MLALKPPKLDSCQDIKDALAKNIALSEKLGLFNYGERLNGLDYCDVEDEKKYKKLELAEKELRLIKNRIAGRLTSCIREIKPEGTEDWKTLISKMNKAIEALDCLEKIADEQGGV